MAQGQLTNSSSAHKEVLLTELRSDTELTCHVVLLEPKAGQQVWPPGACSLWPNYQDKVLNEVLALVLRGLQCLHVRKWPCDVETGRVRESKRLS